MLKPGHYDVCIVGGGLAGLALSIQMAKLGYTVSLFEKEQYPFHKVCGEYISMESWNFIESLGVPLAQMNLPHITKLQVSAPNGNLLTAPLPLGGFGISRYLLDDTLKNCAIKNGVLVIENSKVEDVQYTGDGFSVQTRQGIFTSTLCFGSFGKRSNLDIKWKRPFVLHKNNKLSNYVGIKYHIITKAAEDSIALHNFKNGYCGISKIEDNKFCLCYLTNAANLAAHQNSIQQMEQAVLKKNKHLRQLLEQSEQLFTQPISISQISFNKKAQVQDHIILLGDAAGMISPLCGNGMSMALHAAKIAAALGHLFLQNKLSRQQLEATYVQQWKKQFASRLAAGRLIQSFFGKVWITNIFITCMKRMPFLTRWLIRQTHGQPF
ncbi:MAG: hypothetical protein RL172_1868 [Bacteroidota bacterium]|jgi:menaquinone-9 beta-reductase